ncbi:MAG: DNA-binding protein Alba [Candidatus Micrarchaeota archaeon]
MEGELSTRDNIVYIGKKPVMNYVLAVITLFSNGAPEVSIKARGLSISRAVDAGEIVRHKFLPDVKVKSITTETEEMTSERDGRKSMVSSINITLSK